jgi:hypothetical protein
VVTRGQSSGLLFLSTWSFSDIALVIPRPTVPRQPSRAPSSLPCVQGLRLLPWVYISLCVDKFEIRLGGYLFIYFFLSFFSDLLLGFWRL